MDAKKTLRFLVSNAGEWISLQREVHRPHAGPVPALHRGELTGLFEPTTLENARIRRVPIIDNPSFYAQLGQVLLDFRVMAGITYGDTILISSARVPGEPPVSLVFHELVHVVQYIVLGIEEFARQYVLGWAENGFDYLKIPLETQAYGLQARFESDGLSGISVEAEIRGLLNV